MQCKEIEWPKCFTAALWIRTWSSSLLLFCIVRAKTQRQYRNSRVVCNASVCTVWMSFLLLFFFGCILFCFFSFNSQALITVHQISGWFFWLAFCFLPSPIHHTENQDLFIYFSTARDWHRAEMQNNNPLITWVLPVLGFICNGRESP